jgi:succinate dehydrogenase / fumarate reductase cytochrome b subunit
LSLSKYGSVCPTVTAVDLNRVISTLRAGSTFGDPSMADQTGGNEAARPLSPHLQIYRWPVTMATSIAHRATGIALAAGTLLVAWWLIAMADGAEAYHLFSLVARNPAGQIVLFGFVWSLTFHLLNGIRHLAWDVGLGFAVPTANRTGVAAIVLSFVLAVAVFAYAYVQKGLHV